MGREGTSALAGPVTSLPVPDAVALELARPTQDWLRWATRMLANSGSPSPALDATVLLRWLLHASPSELAARADEPLARELADHYAAWVRRRAGGEPVAYITGHKAFLGLDLFVDARVLLPRPLTAAVVEVSLELIRVRGRELTAADIGTGSGAVAIALAVHEPLVRRVYATDISRDALEVARHNGGRHGLEGRIAWLAGDLLEPVPEPVDLVVANLPYVPTVDRPDRTAARFEPGIAFFGGSDGLDLVRRFIGQLPAKLRRGGIVVLEIGPGQRPAVEAALRLTLPGVLIGGHAMSDQVVVGEWRS